MDKFTAGSIATSFGIDTRKDFFTLNTEEVQRVINAADHVKYRKPKNANGSRGRYFFAAMQRARNRAD